MTEDKIKELFETACNKELYPGVQSIHSNEIIRFANIIIMEQQSELKMMEDALRKIIDVGPENNEWDAVERVLPEILAIAKMAINSLNRSK